MINGVSSINSSMSMMQNDRTQRPPPPQEKDIHHAADSDGNGLVSETELENLVKGIEEITGESIQPDDALSLFDNDQDGGLNGEELLGLMSSIGFSLPEIADSGNNELGLRPPPPPSIEHALSSYTQIAEDDPIAQLIALLQKNDNAEETTITSINITL